MSREVSISSKKNPRIRKILNIKERPSKFLPSHQRQEGEVLIEGPLVLEQAMRGKGKFRFALITERILSDERRRGLLETLTEEEIPVYVVSMGVMNTLTDTEASQGIIGIMGVKAYSLDDLLRSDGGCFIVIDGIQDPGNMGTIIRTAEAFGIGNVIILKGSVNPFNPKSIRASAGGVFSARIYFLERDLLFKWKEESGSFWIATTGRGETELKDIRREGRVALVFGNEADGVGEDILQRAEMRLRIPLKGKAESLNVAVAAGLVMYEYARDE